MFWEFLGWTYIDLLPILDIIGLYWKNLELFGIYIPNICI